MYYSAHVYPLFNSDDFSHLLNQREPAETGDWLNVIIQITDSRAPAPAEPARHQVEVALYRDFRFVKLQDGTWKANAEMLANAIQTSGAVIKGMWYALSALLYSYSSFQDQRGSHCLD